MPAPTTLSLLAALPADAGECECTRKDAGPLAGWQRIRLVLGDGTRGLRVVVAIYDEAGRTRAVSDLVASAGGTQQESLQARVEPDGRMQGTHWVSDGDQHAPRPLTEGEMSGRRELANALRARCAAGGAA